MADEKTGAPQGQDAGAPSIGQGGSIPRMGQGDQAPQGQAEFYSYAHPDGKVEKFTSRDELDKWFRGSAMRTSDYTRKSMELAKERETFKKEQEEHKKQQEALQKEREKYDGYNRVLQSRPEVFRQLQSLAQSPASPSEIFDRAKEHTEERYKALEQRVEAFEAAQKQQAQEREFERVMSALAEEYPDFDREAVNEQMTAISSGETEQLLRTLYFAAKGRTPRQEVEKSVLDKLEQKRKAGIMPSSKGSPPREAPKQFKSVREARDYALERETGG